MKVCHFRDDFSKCIKCICNEKTDADRLRREAFGVRRIPALCESSARREAKAPEYGALQTLRAVRLRLCRAGDRRALPLPTSACRNGNCRMIATKIRNATCAKFIFSCGVCGDCLLEN